MSEDTHAKIGTVESFRIGKGVSKENVDGTWFKEYIEITVKLPEGATGKDFLANFVGAEAMIDQLLEAPQTAAPAQKTTPAQQPAQVKVTMTPGEVDTLPWTASNWVRKDDPNRNARPMEDAWIKLENSDSRLIRMLDESHGKLELPPYTFEFKEFADSKARLIVRRGPKEKKPSGRR
jgi:hypothetical protein